MSDQLTIHTDAMALLPQLRKAVHSLWKSANEEVDGEMSDRLASARPHRERDAMTTETEETSK